MRQIDITSHVEEARAGGPKGFLKFYAILHNKRPPKHVEEEWVPWLFECMEGEDMAMLWASRGITKTTTVATLCAYLMGLHPEGSSLIIRSNDEWAKESARNLMAIIDNQPGWKAVFPHVVPDRERGWGVEVMWLKDTSLPEGVWERKLGNRIDPSIVCAAYKSRRIRGLHPMTFIGVDDILDEDNAYSEREHRTLEKIVAETIGPIRRPHNPFEVWIGTPFHDQDIYSQLVRTETFKHLVTPASRDDLGNPAWPGEPVWPEGLGKEALQKELQGDITGGAAFRRQYLCDIYAGEGGEIRVQEYQGELDPMWPVWGGIDFASVPEPGSRMTHRSHAAIAYLTRIPGGPAIIRGGDVGQWTQDQTENQIKTMHNIFPNFQYAGIDTAGKGEIFYETFIARNPGTRVMPVPKSIQKKAQRIFAELSPHFNNGTLLWAPDDTKFLNAGKRFCRVFPNVPPQYDLSWDVMDAIYYAWKAMNGELIMPSMNQRREKKKSPFRSLAKMEW